jgi:hypothetical protein
MLGKLSKRAQKHLQENGVRCQATVLEIAERGMSVTTGNPNLVANTEMALKAKLRVESELEPAFEVHQRFRFSQFAVPAVGMQVPVIYDPKDHDKIMLDDSVQGGMHHMAERLRARAGQSAGGVDLNAIANTLEASAAGGNVDPEELQRQIRQQVQGAGGGNVAGVPPVAPIPPAGFPPPQPAEDPVDKLTKLQELKEKGVLTDAEFEAQKARILADS